MKKEVKSIILKSLELNHFKGIKHLKVDFNHRTDISGDNASGKTTIFDAFTWLLFDKDSLDRKSFGIKTYDGQGDTLHGVDHSVEGTLEVDGQPIHLKKTYSEIWTKKRGKTDAEFTGHTTDYEINSVPVKKADYDNRIQSIIPEEQFKLLTNPHYFNEVLDWKKRREIVLGLEEINDMDVLYTFDTPPFDLLEKIKDYTVDEIKAMTKASMKKLNDEIKDLPVRIDELTNQIIEHDFKALEIEKKELQSEYNLLSGQIEDVQQIIQAANAKAKLLVAKKAKLFEIEQQVERNYQNALGYSEQRRKKAKQDEEDRQYSIERLRRDIERKEEEIVRMEDRRKGLLESWEFIQKRLPPAEEICPSCGQAVPEEKLQETINQFNLNKSKDSESIIAQGKAQKEEIAREEETLQKLRNGLTNLEGSAVPEPEVEEITKPDLPQEWHDLKAEIEADEKTMQEEETMPSQSEMSAKKFEIADKISAIDEQLGQRKRNTDIKARIDQLKASEKDLARNYEQQEKLLKQVEDFIKAKVDLISDKVNAHFDRVTFKLFDIQVNGGLVETCEVMVDGTPYSDLNNAAKINAGLDVINTLAKVYQTTAPVFIDNAESVNQLTETDAQLIRLIVSKDKPLKIS